ncbi:hypothetical protein O3M35_011841 [Rhynocoris fuscipes]|uniref:CCDC174 alpha/beta GRSR domain-containing protein n=1 Tax=Rhynocoris fuscipes TaxID=488301 RepID=A0AAW1D274_9HEMI
MISLKAELTRKQEEVKKVKEHESYIKLPPKPKPIVKTNPGVEERNENDIRLSEEEVDLLKKSKEVLEIKAAIYDKCQKGELVPNDGKSHYLVDFGRKSPEPSTSQQFVEEKTSDDLKDDEVAESDGDEDQNDEIDLDPDEWIEYTDCLGRTRKCHRSDLDKMKDRDKSLAAQLNMQKENQPAAEESISNEDKVAASGEQLQERELLSKDMHLEELRKKWEEQEIKLANKSEIHYEDVLFNGESIIFLYIYFPYNFYKINI